jgi:hypothetical protein
MNDECVIPEGRPGRFVALTLAASAFSIAFIALAARDHLARGGPMRARTFASNSTNDPARAERDVLLYQYVTRTVPVDATIAVMRPDHRDADQQMSRIGHGQLPFQRVVPQETLESNDAPDFVLAIGGRFDDPRYELVYEVQAGSLWRSRR